MSDQTTALYFAYGYGGAAIVLILLAVIVSRRKRAMTLGSVLLGGLGFALAISTSQAVYAVQYLAHA